MFFTIQKQKRMKTFYSTIIMNTLKSLGSNGKIQQLISKFLLNLSKDKEMTVGREIRLKLHIEESRIWNMGMKNVKSKNVKLV